MKKSYFRKDPSPSNIDLRSEENILRSQGRYVPMSQKLQRWIPYSLFLVIVVVIIVVWVMGVKREQAIARDAQRLADMNSVQMAFEALFRETNQYDDAAAAGCHSQGMEVSTCLLSDYLPLIGEINDPGTFAYAVTGVPSGDRYEVTFELERSYGSLLAGTHRLNQDGIR